MNERIEHLATDLISTANADILAMVAWCQEQIADHCYSAKLPPDAWAGREDVVLGCSKHFSNPDLMLCGSAVDQAVLSLWHVREDDPQHFQKQTLLLRIKAIRKMVRASIENGHSEIYYDYVPLAKVPDEERPEHLKGVVDPLMRIEIKSKRKEYRGTSAVGVRLLLSIERMIAELDGMFGAAGNAVSVVNQIFAKLDERSAGQDQIDDQARSPAARAKGRSLNDPMTAQQRKLLTTIVTMPDATVASVEDESVKIVPGANGDGREPKK